MMERAPVYDIKGREIRHGDLLRSHHYIDRRTRRNIYLYHGVIARNDAGYLEAVPVTELCGRKPDGGRVWIVPGNTCGFEIVYGPAMIDTHEGPVCWYERPRKQPAAKEPAT